MRQLKIAAVLIATFTLITSFTYAAANQGCNVKQLIGILDSNQLTNVISVKIDHNQCKIYTQRDNYRREYYINKTNRKIEKSNTVFFTQTDAPKEVRGLANLLFNLKLIAPYLKIKSVDFNENLYAWDIHGHFRGKNVFIIADYSGERILFEKNTSKQLES